MIYGVSADAERAARHDPGDARRRYFVAGHRKYCAALTEISIRLQGGVFRITRGCACGALREFAPPIFATFGEAEEALRAVRGR